eukprot:434026-Lingulodinium_polyedra.AAC.1
MAFLLHSVSSAALVALSEVQLVLVTCVKDRAVLAALSSTGVCMTLSTRCPVVRCLSVVFQICALSVQLVIAFGDLRCHVVT